SAYLSGNLDRFFQLPGGSLGWSAGFEYREEDSNNGQSFADLNGLGFGGASILATAGSYDVAEFFGEARAPLLADLPLVKDVTLDGAIRRSEYSTIGGTTTWKVGGQYAPIADISFRSTYAEAVRAPNVGELFDPGGQTFLFIEDPCSQPNLNLGTSFRAANCAAILSSLGVDPTTYVDPNIGSVRGLQTGNADLEEEKAKTFTVGAVLQPSFVKGLTLSFDYYDIKLGNAINTLDPQDIANQCVDLPTIVNQFCDALTRAPGTDLQAPGGIVDYLIQPVNVASFRTKGVDFTVNYVLDPANFGATSDWGVFNVHLVGNHLHELSYVNLVGADPDPQKGELNKPEWQGNLDVTWVKGPVTINYGLNYFSATQRYTLQEIAGEPDIADGQYLKYSEKFSHDIQARWNVDDHYEIYAGVDNFTDQRPDIGESFYPVSAVGRFFYIGATATFDSLGAMLSNK
ncbi:MAG: TonB-dependent receptor, partial [Caulobacterales bacterium]